MNRTRGIFAALIIGSTLSAGAAIAKPPPGMPARTQPAVADGDRRDARWDLKKLQDLQDRFAIARKRDDRKALKRVENELQQYVASELREFRSEVREVRTTRGEYRHPQPPSASFGQPTASLLHRPASALLRPSRVRMNPSPASPARACLCPGHRRDHTPPPGIYTSSPSTSRSPLPSHAPTSPLSSPNRDCLPYRLSSARRDGAHAPGGCWGGVRIGRAGRAHDRGVRTQQVRRDLRVAQRQGARRAAHPQDMVPSRRERWRGGAGLRERG